MYPDLIVLLIDTGLAYYRHMLIYNKFIKHINYVIPTLYGEQFIVFFSQ